MRVLSVDGKRFLPLSPQAWRSAFECAALPVGAWGAVERLRITFPAYVYISS